MLLIAIFTSDGYYHNLRGVVTLDRFLSQGVSTDEQWVFAELWELNGGMYSRKRYTISGVVPEGCENHKLPSVRRLRIIDGIYMRRVIAASK